MAGDAFSIENLLSMGAKGEAPKPAGIAAPKPAPAPTLPATPMFSVEGMLKQGVAGELPKPAPMSKEGGTLWGLLRNFAAGAPEGIAGTLDALHTAMNPTARSMKIQEFAGGQRMPGLLDLLRNPEIGGVDLPGTAAIQPHGAGERIARSAGVGAGSSIMPGAGVGSVLMGAAGQGLARTGAELLPDEYKNIGEAVLSVPAAMATHAAVQGIKKGLTAGGALGWGAREVRNEAGGSITGTNNAPVRATQTQMLRAGEKLRDAVGSEPVPAGPPAVGPAMDMSVDFEGLTIPGELIPPGGTTPLQRAQAALDEPSLGPGGVQRTTAQQTQSPGLVALEGTYKQASPAQFNARSAAQAEGMSRAITGLAPEGAVAASPGRLLADRLRGLDDAETAATAARGPVQAATDAMGGMSSGEAQGTNLRTGLEAKRAPAKAAASAPWNVLRADPTLAVDLSPTFEFIRKTTAEMSPTDAAVPGMEKVNSLIAAGLKNKRVLTFDQISNELRNASALERDLVQTVGRESPATRLAGFYKQSLYDSIAHTVDLTAQREAAAVGAGVMRPEETLAARLEADAVSRAGQSAEARMVSGTGAAEGGAGQPVNTAAGVAGADGTGIPPNGGLGGAGGNSGVAGTPGAALEPNFPAAAADQYAAGRARYAKYKETFGTGPVGDVLMEGTGGKGTYRIANADAVRRFFDAGAKTPEQVKKLAEAMGGMENVLPIAREQLAYQLRKAGAVTLDGMVDPRKFDNWIRSHGETLNLFPELKAEFGNAKAAQVAYDAALAQAQANKLAFQKSAAAYFLSRDPNIGAVEPAVAVQRAFAAGPEALRNINRMLMSHPDALAGWKAAVTDYIVDRFRAARPATENADFIKSGQFRNFISENRDSLKAVYGGQGINTLEAIEGELRRQAYSPVAGVGSPTTQYMIGARGEGLLPGGKAPGVTSMMALAGAQLGEHAAGLAGGVGGAVALPWLSAKTGALRQGGIDSLNGLIREALLNPQLARVLMQKIPANADVTPQMMRRIGAALVAGKAAQEQPSE